MENILRLPDDVFKHHMLQYLTVDDIVELDNSCMNHKYRSQILEKIVGVILSGDKDKSMKISLFKWLGMRRIYLINVDIGCRKFVSNLSIVQDDYVEQLKYTKNITLKRSISDDMAVFLISHCPNLQSIYCIELSNNSNISVIAEHCPKLQLLSFERCKNINDTELIAISKHCPSLTTLNTVGCSKLTDSSIISISTHCKELQRVDVFGCTKITDASIISISQHCPRLESLRVCSCICLTDASIISLSTHCVRLKKLDLWGCDSLTNASIISISNNCSILQDLLIEFCSKLTDDCLIAIVKNCNSLQLLHASMCNGITSSLRQSFNSSSELRDAILSIYPTLP